MLTLILVVTSFVTVEKSSALAKIWLGSGYGAQIVALKGEFDIPTVPLSVHAEVGYNLFLFGIGGGAAWNFLNVGPLTLGLEFDLAYSDYILASMVTPALLLKADLGLGAFHIEGGIGGRYGEINILDFSTSSAFGVAYYVGLGIGF